MVKGISMKDNNNNDKLGVTLENKSNIDKKLIIKQNLKILLIYSLSIVISLGFNELIIVIFNKISNNNRTIYSHVLYVFFMTIILIMITYNLNISLTF
jgi:hypothetical protein